jgi:hypothetical protein
MPELDYLKFNSTGKNGILRFLITSKMPEITFLRQNAPFSLAENRAKISLMAFLSRRRCQKSHFYIFQGEIVNLPMLRKNVQNLFCYAHRV